MLTALLNQNDTVKITIVIIPINLTTRRIQDPIKKILLIIPV